MNDSGTAIAGTRAIVNTGSGTGYHEGSWMWKLNSIYYLVYAFQPNNTGNEIIAYSTASNAQGPWTYRGQICDRNASEWTIHSGCCFYNNKWYFFWHDITSLGGNLFGWKRCSAIEYMTINGTTITPMAKTLRGVGIASAAADTIQVDRYSSATGTIALTSIAYNAGGSEAPGWYLSGIANNASVQYNDVDFTPTAGNVISTVVARVASSNANGTIQVRLGSATGTLLGTIPIPNTGSLTNWQTTPVLTLTTKPPIGVQNLVLVFGASATGTYNVNWVKFGQVPGTLIKTGADYSGQSGFEFQRTDKNTFTIYCANEAANTEIRLFNVNGREMANALRTVVNGRNNLSVYLNENRIASGVYIVSIKNGTRALQVPFTY